MSRMIDVPVKNEELLKTLNKFLWFYEERENLAKYVHMTGEGSSRKDWCSDSYKEHIVELGSDHEGFPEKLQGWNVDTPKMIDNIKNMQGEGDSAEAKQNEWLSQASKVYSEANKELMSFVCSRNNALATLYPPDGFISWHNNANASAYNFIFTWSETGDGHFAYIDAKTGEDVIVKDIKGWQCKAGYFGNYAEYQDSLCYHAAETDCWRFTLGYMLSTDDLAMDVQEDVISEISGEF